MDAAEIERRNRYWFDHWETFTCTVTVSVPEQRSAHVGAFTDGGLFGSIPIPFTGHDVEAGQFGFRNGCFLVYTHRTTYSWAIVDTPVFFFDGGAEIRLPNQPTVTIRGPVVAPLAGAYSSYGLLKG